jgi:hypothetical protein
MKAIKILMFISAFSTGVYLCQGCTYVDHEAARFREAQAINTPEAYLCFLEDGRSSNIFNEEYFRKAKDIPAKEPNNKEFIKEAKERLRKIFESAAVKNVEVRFINPSASGPPLRGGRVSPTNRTYDEGLDFFETFLLDKFMEALRGKGFTVTAGSPISCTVPLDIENRGVYSPYMNGDYLRQYFLGALEQLDSEKIEQRECDALILFAIPELRYLWLREDWRGGFSAIPGGLVEPYGWNPVAGGPDGRDLSLANPKITESRELLWMGIPQMTGPRLLHITDDIESITILYYIFDLRSKMRIWAGISLERRSYRYFGLSNVGIQGGRTSWQYTEGVHDLCSRAIQNLLADLP